MPERRIRPILPRYVEFQPIVGYRDFARIPHVVVNQTDTLLWLFRQRAINKPGLARDYLHDYTIQCLVEAEHGCDVLFNPAISSIIDLEFREAASYTHVVFAWMHKFYRPPNLPDGLTGKEMLRAPRNKEEFLARVRELKLGLYRVAYQEAKFTGDGDWPLLRTFAFFTAGSRLPINFPESERERLERQKEEFNQLLGDAKVDFD